ncbi:hypothetical protein GGR56DRAFT_404677 [Xylariaceae sp. FL0804]|nr:hypothetical protein GGR56DRAFT_404677 [Xylariaceae sp. FL0804]
MAPWVRRFHLFEINDQPWFPSFLRAYVQTGLTHAWTVHLPLLQSCTAAELVARMLYRVLGDAVPEFAFVDFCAGAGGPTPSIEQALNAQLLRNHPQESKNRSKSLPAAEAGATAPSYAAIASTKPTRDVPGDDSRDSGAAAKFILTDLHPHKTAWDAAARNSPHLSYVEQPVDATDAPMGLIRDLVQNERVFRLFNLAFHHFDDELARRILRNTVETSDGFGIFELQSRDPSSVLTCCLFGVFIMLLAPVFYWHSPHILFFVWCLPIVPFVLVFDGVVSALRTRTPDEVEALLRTCGAKGADSWVIRSGEERFLWPTGRMNWIICTRPGVAQDSESPQTKRVVNGI